MATGGVGPYSYQWGASANNQTTALAISLTEGQHCVTITDANACTYIDCVNIASGSTQSNPNNPGGPTTPVAGPGSVLKPIPNPNTGAFMLKIYDFEENCRIEIYDSLGKKVNQYVADSDLHQVDISGLAKGVYYVFLKGNNDKVSSAKVIMN